VGAACDAVAHLHYFNFEFNAVSLRQRNPIRIFRMTATRRGRGFSGADRSRMLAIRTAAARIPLRR
jgi:hypothetical protein